MRSAVVALVAYYAGLVAPMSIAPIVMLALLVLIIAFAWATGLEAALDKRDRPVAYIEVPVARSRKAR